MAETTPEKNNIGEVPVSFLIGTLPDYHTEVTGNAQKGFSSI